MKTLGIIAEYNPFHNGHLYHLEESRRLTGADTVVAVMSGNFVQRGEPAIADKWARAEMAVESGVDLVLELPFAFAVNNAEYFARGAVGILEGLGCVDFLSFGSEEGSTDNLYRAAEIAAVEGAAFKKILRESLDRGFSYPKARGLAIAEIMGVGGEFMKKSNNILGIEYIKQLIKTGSDMEIVTVKREGNQYLSEELMGVLPSASAIRANISKSFEIERIEGYIPPASAAVFKQINNNVKLELNDFYNIIAYKILESREEELKEIFAMGEGLENRLKTMVRRAESGEELISLVISKRYTDTRIRRILLQTLMGLDKKTMEEVSKPQALYGRILGFSSKGASLLKNAKKSEKLSIPLITNINKDRLESEAGRALISYDILASDIYNLVLGRNVYEYSDFIRKPYKKILNIGECT